MTRSGLFGLVLSLVSFALAADTVSLKGGGKVSGRMVTRTDSAIEVDVGAGNVKVSMANVVRVEEKRSALDDYAQKAAALSPRDADGWRELGRWASSQGLNTQARQAYEKVVAISPNDPEANAALGNVRVNGRFVNEEEAYRARGA